MWAGREGDDRGWDGWMASPPRWTWVWVSSGSWWWTGRPGVLRFMGSQSWTQLSDRTELISIFRIFCSVAITISKLQFDRRRKKIQQHSIYLFTNYWHPLCRGPSPTHTASMCEAIMQEILMWLSVIPWSLVWSGSLSVEFSRQEYGVGCHFLLQRIFLTQGLNPQLWRLLHWQAEKPLRSHLRSH